MNNKTKRLLIIILCLTISSCNGCMVSIIAEDSVYEPLPPIDPFDGIVKEHVLKLYFRFGDDNLLAPIEKAVPVMASERVEMAALRSLLDGPPSTYRGLGGVFPAGTRVVSMSLDGNILYVTMSREFLNDYLETGTSEENINAHKLSVLSIVNTLTSIGNAKSVFIFVDTVGTGSGTRVKKSQLGLAEAGDEQLMEPMPFDSSIVVDATKLATVKEQE